MLARRTRLLSLNARAAMRVAPAVARVMAAELGKAGDWERAQVAAFTAIAERYLPA